MRKIKKPNINQKDVCSSFKNLMYEDRTLEKYEKYEDILSKLEENYNEEKTFESLNTGYTEYMKKMYKSRFSNKLYTNQYEYYTKLRSSQKYCPYCNFHTREVKQLDHYLPKSKFPSLSLVVKNLVPICKDCNEVKDDFFSFDYSEQFIHPYYDEKIEDAFKFLQCDIIEDKIIGFKFYIKKLSHWDDVFFEKVKFHFKKLEIDKLYLSDFNTEFDVVFDELKEMYKETNSEELIRISLQRKVKVYDKKKIMPWRHAGFKSLLDSDWFFESYFSNK
ncbi:HNH endonuclease [Clostridium intestinale]|uniref:HNH endonuclease n=1 Tax=Clostridium intestinale DSM 6191 TaxID=1121320 RepID=A0A1M6A5G4_9CLOT|nr:HNH endonuclease signature motif containing protein [Clostridium intestinale]SHI31443.1 HNH endonuclease [Clostridium intestinale DSM 6191]